MELRMRVYHRYATADAPERTKFAYTFDHLAQMIDRFTTAVGLNRYAIYIFDYGAPIGLRLALRHPERIAAIITQNGNSYAEGLSEGWNPIQKYWKEPTPPNRAALRNFLTFETTRWQYLHGASDETLVAPESYMLDAALLARPGNEDIQLDLFLDYASNVALYPKFQEYFRQYRPPLLAVWGQSDPFFLPSGANAFKRDIPDAEIVFYETGHFALETHAEAIAASIRDFLGRRMIYQAAACETLGYDRAAVVAAALRGRGENFRQHARALGSDPGRWALATLSKLKPNQRNRARVQEGLSVSGGDNRATTGRP
jgi:pimeloyl-ACP methyl ester carboxylesterase